MEQSFGLLRGVYLPAFIPKPLPAPADRKMPVAPELKIVIPRLQRFIVEGVCLLPLRLLRPDERFVSVAEPHAAKIGHRIGFHPRHVVEDPVSNVLND